MKLATFFTGQHLERWGWKDFIAGRVALSGTDAQLLGLTARLMAAGHDVTPLFSGGPYDPPECAVEVADLAAAAAVAKRCRAEVLLFNDRNDAATLRGITACERYGQVGVMWAHNGPFDEAHLRVARSAAIRRVVCVSTRHADQHRYSTLWTKVAVIHNALMRETAAHGKRNPQGVCFLGAPILEKGFHHLVRAWREVRALMPGAALTVFGSANLYNRSAPLGPLGLSSPEFEAEFIAPFWGIDRERLLSDLGVTLAGLMPPLELEKCLGKHLVAVVNPWVSRGGSIETFCASAIEAQAAGCVVVGGASGGLLETVQDGKTGRLLRRESDLAITIVHLLADPAGAIAMGDAGRQWVRREFAPERIDSRWLELFSDVTAGRRNRPPPLSVRASSLRPAARRFLQLARHFLRPASRESIPGSLAL